MAPQTRDERIAELTQARLDADAMLNRAQAERDKLDAELLALVDPTSSWEGDYEGLHFRTTHVQGSTTYFDEAGFLRQNPLKVWNKISRRTFDQNKLTEALAAGQVEPDQIEPFILSKPKKPYIKVTVGKAQS